MKPEALLEHAELLTSLPRDGRPRRVDLRRAVSAAYYAVFHAIVGACAFEHAGQGGARYDLVYRSIDHRRIEQVCKNVTQPPVRGPWAQVSPAGGFSAELRSAATAFVDLKARRHAADYAPELDVKLDEAREAVIAARRAIAAFGAAPAEHRKLFLTLLLCGPRG